MKNQDKASVSETPKNKELFHFSGGGLYQPMSIEAGSYQEALEKWEKDKKEFK